MKRLKVKAFNIIYGIICKLVPTDKRAIVFESSTGNNWSGSPKAIYDEMVRMGLDKKYRCHIVMKSPEGTVLSGRGKLIKRKTISHLLTFARCGIWVSDARMPAYLIKKKGVHYIQTWHGTPLKKLALDMEQLSMGGSSDLEAYKRRFVRNSSTWDYLVSQNAYSTEIFRRCFAFDGRMLETGYPRCDVLTRRNTPDEIAKIKKELSIPEGKKVLLYAPTWRDDEFYAKGSYKYESPLDFPRLRDALGDEWIVLVKFHYLVADTVEVPELDGFVRNFSRHDDISLLYLVSDAMITDYSSVMFDYAILDRPMYFFCYDLEKYRDTLRGFYFDFESKAPGPITRTTAELIDAIKTDGVDLFKEKRAAFRETFVATEDGHASEKIISLIESFN
ncbi:MAG: CDP-glycerol glycerophosphotransferase family protein [Eubacterium sp.]|nr:CDP-glycerol glycerophosphotransferase family protein [Eubacterium sp.]